jgi:hypothetical protein
MSSPAGQGSARFDRPFSPDEVQALQSHLSGEDPFDEGPAGLAELKRFGGRLFEAVFADQVLSRFTASMALCRERGAALRVRLHLDDAPELAQLPWEYLYSAERNRFFGLSAETPIVRYLDLGLDDPTLTTSAPLRVAVILASPSDYDALDIDAEWRRIRSALVQQEARGQIVVQRVENGTMAALRRHLRENQPHVLQFAGHGDFDPDTRQGVLLFEDDSGRGQRVAGEMLATVLGNCASLRLAILNSCDGARGDHANIFSGTAQRLVQQGLPAVIAMQFPVTDRAAIVFANEFYGSIADGYAIDAALTEARVAMNTSGAELEWGTPVLFMRSPDGRLFDIRPLTEAERRSNEVDRLRRTAQAAEQAEDWDTAAQSWQSLLVLEPADPEAKRQDTRARDQQKMRKLLADAEQDERAGRLAEAYDTYYKVIQLGGNFDNALGLLTRVKRRLLADSAGAASQIQAPPESGALDRHFEAVLDAFSEGNLIVFLGTDANICGRPPGERWVRGLYLPSGAELAQELATSFAYPGADKQDLVRVAEYVEIIRDWGTLYDSVRNLLNGESPPTPLHHFLARVPSRLRAHGFTPEPQFIVTANFDDALERAFAQADEPFDVVLYSRQDGSFSHLAFGETTPRAIDIPNQYVDLPADPRRTSTVIVKIHGAFDRTSRSKDSYVITEDNYIDYSARIPTLVPAALAEKLTTSHSLFLGYSMRDWNLRVFLHPIWRRWNEFRYAPWVVPMKVEPFERRFWDARNAEVVEISIDEYIAALSQRLQTLDRAGALV